MTTESDDKQKYYNKKTYTSHSYFIVVVESVGCSFFYVWFNDTWPHQVFRQCVYRARSCSARYYYIINNYYR